MDDAQATHSIICPVEGCGEKIGAHAHSDEEVVQSLSAARKEHIASKHPNEKQLSDEELKSSTKSLVQSHGHQAH